MGSPRSGNSPSKSNGGMYCSPYFGPASIQPTPVVRRYFAPSGLSRCASKTGTLSQRKLALDSSGCPTKISRCSPSSMAPLGAKRRTRNSRVSLTIRRTSGHLRGSRLRPTECCIFKVAAPIDVAPAAGTPTPLFAPNITPGATGLSGWAADDVATVLKNGNVQGVATATPQPKTRMCAFGRLPRSVTSLRPPLPRCQITLNLRRVRCADERARQTSCAVRASKPRAQPRRTERDA